VAAGFIQGSPQRERQRSAWVRHVLSRQDGPTVLVGHSYGGQVITSLGTDAPDIAALVCVAAFGLDEGGSIGGLLAQGGPTPALAHLDVDGQGFAWLPEDDFVGHFAAGVDPARARVAHAVQQRGDPAGRRAALRRPDGGDDGRGRLRAPADALPPGPGGRPGRDRRAGGPDQLSLPREPLPQ
jgi:pimeloyl-ACP methyl ester carboxylesterase